MERLVIRTDNISAIGLRIGFAEAILGECDEGRQMPARLVCFVRDKDFFEFLLGHDKNSFLYSGFETRLLADRGNLPVKQVAALHDAGAVVRNAGF